MKCPEAEKLIYLLDVLENVQIEEVKDHMISCPQCQRLYQRMEHEQAIIRRVFQTPGPSGSEAELTDRIMAALPGAPDRQANIIDLILKTSWRRSAQYALGAVSLFLIVFFITEYNQPLQIQRSLLQVETAAHEKVVELDSKSFYRRGDPLTESVQRVVPVSLYQCLQACQTLNGDCLPCKIKYARINKHYENI